jgi:flavodoxin
MVNLSPNSSKADNILLAPPPGVARAADDWYDGVKTIRQTNLSGKKVAILDVVIRPLIPTPSAAA